jgi:hypothetical protein
MAAGSGRDGNFDLGVCGGKGGELFADEDAGCLLVVFEGWDWRGEGRERTSCPWSCRPSRSSGSRASCIGGRMRRRHSIAALASIPPIL